MKESNVYVQSDKSSNTRQLSDPSRKCRECALCFFIPLQSTKGDMHTARTIDIGLHKQRMYAYTYQLCLQQHVLNNKRPGFLKALNRRANNSYIYSVM